jgi:O-antigen/teichoic acid export membrane protein
VTTTELGKRAQRRRVWIADPTEDAAGGAAPNTEAARRRPMESVARGALSLFSTQPLTWTVSLLAAALVPRLLGATLLGEYAILMSLGGIAGAIVSLGLPTLLTRSVAAARPGVNAMVAAALVLQTAVAVLAAVAVTLLAPLLHLPVPRVLLALAMAGMVPASVATLLAAVFMGRERHMLYAWFNAGMAVLGTAGGLVGLALGGGLVGLLACSVATSSLTAALAWGVARVRLRAASFNPLPLIRLAGAGLPFVGWNLALQIYGQIDRIILALLAPTVVVGWYAAAYRIISVPVFIPTLIATPLLPVLSRRTGDRGTFAATLRRSTTGALQLSVPVAALIFAIAPSIPSMLHWGSDFEQSVPLIMILVLHQPVVAVDMVLATGLLALKRERAWLAVGVGASIFNPLANLALIPICIRLLHNGAVAASVVTVATELLMLVGALVLLPAGTLDRGTVLLSARILLAGAAAALAGALVRPLCLPLAPLACVAGFLAFGLALRAITFPELVSLLKLPGQVYRYRTANSQRLATSGE